MRLSNPACPESVKPLLHSFVPSLDTPPPTPVPLHSQPGRAVSLSQGRVTHPSWPRMTAAGWSGVQVLPPPPPPVLPLPPSPTAVVTLVIKF